MKRLLWFLQFLGAAVLSFPLAVLPLRASRAAGGMLGMALYYCWPRRRKIAVENLSSAAARHAITLSKTPEEVVRASFANLGKSFIEIVKIYYGLGEGVLKGISVEGMEHLTRARERGNGVLIVTGHCGNWELPSLFSARQGMKINVVARQMNNPYLNRFIERARSKYGSRVIYKRGALKEILLALRRNEAVAVLMDQSVVPAEGVVTEFLGKRDYTMKTPALLARKTGATVLAAFISRTGEGHRVEVGEEISLDASEDIEQACLNDTVRFKEAVEKHIRQHPDEWLWMHRRWKRFKDEP